MLSNISPSVFGFDGSDVPMVESHPASLIKSLIFIILPAMLILFPCGLSIFVAPLFATERVVPSCATSYVTPVFVTISASCLNSIFTYVYI